MTDLTIFDLKTAKLIVRQKGYAKSLMYNDILMVSLKIGKKTFSIASGNVISIYDELYNSLRSINNESRTINFRVNKNTGLGMTFNEYSYYGMKEELFNGKEIFVFGGNSEDKEEYACYIYKCGGIPYIEVSSLFGHFDKSIQEYYTWSENKYHLLILAELDSDFIHESLMKCIDVLDNIVDFKWDAW